MGIFVRSDIWRSAAMLWDGDAVLSPAAPEETAGYQQARKGAGQNGPLPEGAPYEPVPIYTDSAENTLLNIKKSCRF